MSAVGELTQMVSSRKKGGVKEKHPDNKPALVFMAPWLIGLLGITILPMIASSRSPSRTTACWPRRSSRAWRTSRR